MCRSIPDRSSRTHSFTTPASSWPSVPGKERLHILTLEPTQPRLFPVLSPAPFRVTPSEAWGTATCKAFTYVEGEVSPPLPDGHALPPRPPPGQAYIEIRQPGFNAGETWVQCYCRKRAERATRQIPPQDPRNTRWDRIHLLSPHRRGSGAVPGATIQGGTRRDQVTRYRRGGKTNRRKRNDDASCTGAGDGLGRGAAEPPRRTRCTL